jgi:hypothetical protein
VARQTWILQKNWDSNFFHRRFFEINVRQVLTSADIESINAEIQALGGGEATIELRLTSENFDVISEFEEMGFRFVDSRLEFSTETIRPENPVDAPVGLFRQYKTEDWPFLESLTIRSFVDNPHFKSRYKNPTYFTREESIRYYLQWHRWVLDSPDGMFCSWEVDDNFVGFYSILRKGIAHNLPHYKVALAAVEHEYRSLNGQNLMQFYLFANAKDEKWITINSPALTNLSGLKNNIRAQKKLSHVEAFLFLSLK